MTRVVVTGLGVVSACGNEVNEMFDRLCRGESGLRLVTVENSHLKHIKPLSAGIPEFKASKKITGADQIGYYALSAAESAIKDAGLTEFGETTGVYIGNGAGGVQTCDAGFKAIYVEGKKVAPLTILGLMASGPASVISMEYGITGPTHTYSAACASGSMAIGEAYLAIRSGRIDRAITGGVECILSEGIINSWQRIGALADPTDRSPQNCERPFDRDRFGFCLSEGSAMVVLETLESAQARGAKIYAEIIGYGCSSDAYHWTKPSTDGQVRAIRGALKDAKLNPEQIQYCNAHGTGTPVGDPVECQSLRTVWQDSIDQLLVSSTKGQLGHMIGAAGAIEFLISIMSLERHTVPPTINCDHLDPECNINIVRNQAVSVPNLNTIMSSSFAFGGTNTVLIASTNGL